MQKLYESPELIAAVVAAVLVKVKSSKTLNLVGALLTIAIATLAGLFLHVPFRELMGLDPSQDIIVAVLTALLFESVAKWIIDLAAEPGGIKRLIAAVIMRDPAMLTRDDRED